MRTIIFFSTNDTSKYFIILNQAKISIFLAYLRKVILLIQLSNIIGKTRVFYEENTDINASINTFTAFILYSKKVIEK